MKYVIEFEDEPFGRNDDPVIPHGMDELYRAKGFSTLVFDRPGLDKLTPLDDELKKAYDNGYKDGADAEDTESEIYRKCSDSTQRAITKIMKMPEHARETIFGSLYLSNIFSTFSIPEIIAMLERYEADAEIGVGDWVFSKYERNVSAKVTLVDGEDVYVLYGDGSCGKKNISRLEKTNVPNPKVEQLLKTLKDGQHDCSTCRHCGKLKSRCQYCVDANMWQPKDGQHEQSGCSVCKHCGEYVKWCRYCVDSDKWEPEDGED